MSEWVANTLDRARELRAWKLGARGLGVVLGVWVGLFCFADLILRPRHDALIFRPDVLDAANASPTLTAAFTAIVAFGLVPIGIGAVRFGMDFRRSGLFCASIFTIVLAVPLSLLSANELNVFSYVAMTDYVFVCFILLLAINVDGDAMMRAFLASLGLTLAIAMVAALIDHDFAWGRLFGRTAPNYWGGVATIVIMCSFVFRRRAVKVGLVLLSLFVLYSTESRSVLISLSAALLLTWVFSLRSAGADRWFWTIAVPALAFVGVGLVGLSFVADKLLLLSDPLRGLGSGFSGRTTTWREGWEIFSAHPWFGVGYSQAKLYLSSQLAIHNACLTMLAETGIVGLAGYVILFFGALLRGLIKAWGRPNDVNLAQLAVLTSYVIGGIAEPGGLHVGNTHSMLAIFVTANLWRWIPESDDRAAFLSVWTMRGKRHVPIRASSPG